MVPLDWIKKSGSAIAKKQEQGRFTIAYVRKKLDKDQALVYWLYTRT
jgi:hypothetical protein